MKIDELQVLDDGELLELAIDYGVNDAKSLGREMLIKALSTYPENDSGGDYVDNINIGDIVAFRTEEFNVKSAKVVRKSTRGRKLLLETKYGKQFFISFADVIWVNTNGYWPKWIYNLMKGQENAEAEVQ